MSNLHFAESTHAWDFDRYAMRFTGYDGGRRVVCMISGEALQDHFGAIDIREGMEAAFLRNRKRIEERARELYRAGKIDDQGRVLLRSVDFAAELTPRI
jgi:hypothetical protein